MAQEVPKGLETKQPHYYIPTLSSGLGKIDFPQPERNLLSEEGVALGKTLFFDRNLSANQKVSCASCHHPDHSFSDGVAFSSIGISGKPLLRHSPVLFNLAWHEGWFWDGGAKNLESLNFGPLTHPDEMGANLPDLLAYLNSHPSYPKKFEVVFGELPILNAHVSRALAQYTRSLISQESRYDAWKNGETQLNEAEIRGYQLYRNHCASCHTEGLFTDTEYHNNGLDETYPDPFHLEGLYQGRYRISLDEKDRGAYKTASLRNVMLTAPYMHDGRFSTIEEVLDHYEKGIKRNASIATQLQKDILLTHQEKEDLVAFLHTLSDFNFISNPKLKP